MKALRILALLIACSMPAAQAGKWVSMYTDDTYTKKIKRRKLDCRIHRKKGKSFTFGFKFSVPFVVSIGPEIKFGGEMETRWNDMTQELIRRFEELCDEHNKGHLTIAEYKESKKELDEFYERMLRLKDEIAQLVEKRADKAFAELDREEERRKLAKETREAVANLSKQVEALSDEMARRGGLGLAEQIAKQVEAYQDARQDEQEIKGAE